MDRDRRHFTGAQHDPERLHNTPGHAASDFTVTLTPKGQLAAGHYRLTTEEERRALGDAGEL